MDKTIPVECIGGPYDGRMTEVVEPPPHELVFNVCVKNETQPDNGFPDTRAWKYILVMGMQFEDPLYYIEEQVYSHLPHGRSRV